MACNLLLNVGRLLSSSQYGEAYQEPYYLQRKARVGLVEKKKKMEDGDEDEEDVMAIIRTMMNVGKKQRSRPRRSRSGIRNSFLGISIRFTVSRADAKAAVCCRCRMQRVAHKSEFRTTYIRGRICIGGWNECNQPFSATATHGMSSSTASGGSVPMMREGNYQLSMHF